MPLRDYEFVQRAKETGELKISCAWLSKLLDCSPTACKGICCTNHYEGLTAHYHPQEVDKLLDKLGYASKITFIRKYLEQDMSTIKLDENKNCSMIPVCQNQPNLIPVECRLFPLGFNLQGRLVLKRAAWGSTSRCPAYGHGLPAYMSMKQCLVDTLGEQLYERIVKACDYYIFTRQNGRLML